MLIRIVAMLTKLVVRFDPDRYRVGESASDLTAQLEHEHEHEGFLAEFERELGFGQKFVIIAG